MARRLPAIRSLSAQQRALRQQDLMLAADLLRRQIDADLAQLQPAADRVLIWVDATLWLRRHWLQSPRRRRAATALAAAAGIAGAGSIGGWVLRHWHWLRSALTAWRVWKQLRA